jgi:hypothetical protein
MDASLQMQSVPLISYQEFLSILLTAVGIALALVAIELGVLGFWGYKELRRIAEKRVSESMAKVLKRLPEAQQVLEMYEDMKRKYESMKQMHDESTEAWGQLRQIKIQATAEPDPFRAKQDTGIKEAEAGPISPVYPPEEEKNDDD